MFKQHLYEINWKEIKTNQDPNDVQYFYTKSYSVIGPSVSRKREKVYKKKDLKSPWITTRIKFEDAIMSDGHISDGQMYSYFQH